MPEGDTVYLAGRRLDQALAGHTLTRTDFRVPRLATLDLAGHVVEEVRSRGKHLLFRFDDATTLHTHFRMDGTWHLYQPGQPWRGGPAHSIRVTLTTGERIAVGYRLHDIALVATRDEHTLVGHLGPDICADDWDEGEALRRLRAAGDRSVATALVDQRIIAGIGNIYRCESMFIAGLAPATPVREIDDESLHSVVATARDLLMRNRDRASQATTGDERRAHFVYGRRRARCYRCNSSVQITTADATEPWRTGTARTNDRGSANEQAVFWCPTCQPAI
jgi:endonuclease VIII